nr:protein SIEVE ELEMENT OCCLUSION B-like [Ipomoea batatas]
MANFHIDENAMMELVCATHNPDGTNFNSNVVLSAIETILNSEKVVDKVATEDMLEEFDLKFRELSLKIQHLCFERKHSNVYTSERENALWKKEKDWNLDLVVGKIDERVTSWGATMEGWALLSKEQKVVVCGQGAKMLRVINEYENWKENMALKSFDQAFKDYYNKTLHTSCSSNSHSCCAFEYPITLKEIPKKEKCPECFHDMQKLVTFTCYHGDS